MGLGVNDFFAGFFLAAGGAFFIFRASAAAHMKAVFASESFADC